MRLSRLQCPESASPRAVGTSEQESVTLGWRKRSHEVARGRNDTLVAEMLGVLFQAGNQSASHRDSRNTKIGAQTAGPSGRHEFVGHGHGGGSPPKAGAVKRRALDSSREDETLELLSELKKAISNIQSGLSQVQEMIAHPQLGLVALSERILRLEGTHHGFLPSTSTTPVPNLNSVIAPPTEGAILQAALSKPMPKPKHG
ncbi:hypothetical protein MRX96_002139 [Rhipicephalus microplus]